MAAANSASAHGGNVPVAPVQAGNGVTTTQVATPVGNHGWDGEVGEKIAWMANRNESRADLVLNPPHLGRIEVSLSVNGDQANVSFASANPAVREALENAVPKLREVLQGAGISLGQTQVGAESFQQQANNRENGDNPNRGNSSGRGIDTALSNVVSTGSSSASQWLRRGNGLVDTFA
jgi:flagellar hook-length control protein FliK